jgi:hypothetical protein
MLGRRIISSAQQLSGRSSNAISRNVFQGGNKISVESLRASTRSISYGSHHAVPPTDHGLGVIQRQISNIVPLEDTYGTRTFSERLMREKLPGKIYNAYLKCLETNSPISIEIADAIAAALIDWAGSLGVTHFTHWFSPLRAPAAEKHDT